MYIDTNKFILRKLRWWIVLAAVAAVFLADKLVLLSFTGFQLFVFRFFVLCGGLFFFTLSNRSYPRVQFNSLIVALVLYSCASLMWSPSLSEAISELGILIFGGTFAILVTGSIEKESQIHQILTIWFVGALLVNLIGLYEVSTMEYIFTVDESAQLASYRLFESIGIFVPRSVFSNQNNYAYFNSLSFLVLLGYTMQKINDSKRRLIIKLFVLFICFYMVLISYSRSAIFATVLGSLLFFIIYCIRKKLLKYLFIGSGALILVYFLNQESISLVLNAVIEKQANTDDSVRSTYYLMLARYSMSNFGIGMGPGSSYHALNGASSHNHILQFLVEYGVFFWLFFLFLLMRLALILFKSGSALGLMLGITILMYPVHTVGPSSMTTESFFWLWQALIVSAAMIEFQRIMIQKRV